MVASLHIPKRVVSISVGDAAGNARSFGDLRAGELWCSFVVKSWARPKPNTATVQIYNVSKDTARYLKKPNMVLAVNAGNDLAGQLFQGAISNDGAITEDKKQDGVTTIKAADGRRVYRDTLFAKSYPAGFLLFTILQDVAAAMGKPLKVAATIPAALRTYKIPTGWNFAMKARSALDEILLPWGLAWSVISGTLYIIDPLQALPGNAPVIAPDTGLHGSAKGTKKGCKYTTDLDPAIIAGQASVIESDGWSGTVRNEQVTHKGDSWGRGWTTAAMGTKI